MCCFVHILLIVFIAVALPFEAYLVVKFAAAAYFREKSRWKVVTPKNTTN